MKSEISASVNLWASSGGLLCQVLIPVKIIGIFKRWNSSLYKMTRNFFFVLFCIFLVELMYKDNFTFWEPGYWSNCIGKNWAELAQGNIALLLPLHHQRQKDSFIQCPFWCSSEFQSSVFSEVRVSQAERDTILRFEFPIYFDVLVQNLVYIFQLK